MSVDLSNFNDEALQEIPETTPQSEVDKDAEFHEEETSEGAAYKIKPPKADLKEAWKQVETFGQALGSALQGRGNVVMVRVNDEALRHLDMLVETEVTKSRSESAAFLINEGIKANKALYDRIREITDQIMDLRNQLREVVNPDDIRQEIDRPAE